MKTELPKQEVVPFVQGKLRIQLDVAGEDMLAVRRATHALLDMMIESPKAPGWCVGKEDCNGVAKPI